MTALAALLVGTLLGPTASAAAHANSISVSRIEVSDEAIRHELELQTLSVLEVMPALDADGDGELDAEELAAAAGPLADYLDRDYVFTTATPGTEIGASIVRDLAESAGTEGAPPFVLQRFTLVRERALSRPLEDLRIEVSVFLETSPDHRDFCTLAWEGQHELDWLFSAADPRLEYRPDPELASRTAEAAALRGLRDALDFRALGLLLALLVACPSAGIALRATGVYLALLALTEVLLAAADLALPARLVDLAAMLAVAYTAAENALARRPRVPLVEAALFALLHGAAFRALLAPDFDPHPHRLLAGAAHAGALFATLAVAALVLFALVRILPGARSLPEAPAPDWSRSRLSVAITLVALLLFVDLAWLGGASL